MPLAIARTAEDLNTSWFKDLLREIGKPAAADSLSSSDTKPIGTGQMGFVLRSTLHYAAPQAEAPSSLIIKLASSDDTARQTGLALGIYQGEVNFYREVAPNIKMQLPRCLFSDLDEAGWLTIVLEDMSTVARQGDVLVGGTVAQAKHAVTELTRLQAPFWNKAEWLDKDWLAPASAAPLYEVPGQGLELFLARFGYAFSDQQAEVFRTTFPKAQSWFGQWRAPLTITHGDFRLDNMLLATSDAAPPMTTIDWQTVKMGPPLLDVAYYLGACLTPQQRRDHEQDILRTYQASLAELGTDYPWEQLWQDYRFCAWYGVLLCAFAIKVPQTERGDQMFIQAAIGYAEMALDLEILDLIP